jgi:hypothetical protein
MWTCPACQRSFKNTGQKHRCESTTTEAQLESQSEAVIKIYKKLLTIVKKIGPYTESPIKDYIMLKNSSTFITIKPRKKYLDISFFLDQKSEEFPIFKSLQTSKHRVLHAARLESPDDVTSFVQMCIEKSYQLTSA